MVAVADKVENERPVFPFTAIIGQEEMKLALILNVIDPRIGGVMIMGDRVQENQQQSELLLTFYRLLK